MSSTVSRLSWHDFDFVAPAKAGLDEIRVLRDCMSEYGRPIPKGSEAYLRPKDFKVFTPEEYVFEVLAYKGDETPKEWTALYMTTATYVTTGTWDVTWGKPPYGTMVSLSPFTSVDPPDEED